MSQTILTQGYVPEDHAPDPVRGGGDPTPPGKIGIWLFLASEIMFFVAILGTYVIIRGGSPDLFARHAAALSKSLAGLNTLVLLFSSYTMARSVDAAQRGNPKDVSRFIGLTLLCALGFLGIKTKEYRDKALHQTIVAKGDDQVIFKHVGVGPYYLTVTSQSNSIFNGSTFEPKSSKNWSKYAIPLKSADSGQFAATIPAAAVGNTIRIYFQASAEPASTDKRIAPKEEELTAGPGIFVYDGHVESEKDGLITLSGYRMPMPTATDYHGTFDIHLVSEEDVRRASNATRDQEFKIRQADVGTRITYGPWKNIFYASYFTLTGIHGVHVIGGIIPLLILWIQSLRGKLFTAHTEYVGLYWHFVDLVWIFLFPLLYLI